MGAVSNTWHRPLATSRAVLLAAYEDSDVAHGHPLAGVVSDLLDDQHVSRLVLGGLRPAEVARLLAGLGVEDADALAPDVHRRTDGNPFFVTEVARLSGRGAASRSRPPSSRSSTAGSTDWATAPAGWSVWPR